MTVLMKRAYSLMIDAGFLKVNISTYYINDIQLAFYIADEI